MTGLWQALDHFLERVSLKKKLIYENIFYFPETVVGSGGVVFCIVCEQTH